MREIEIFISVILYFFCLWAMPETPLYDPQKTHLLKKAPGVNGLTKCEVQIHDWSVQLYKLCALFINTQLKQLWNYYNLKKFRFEHKPLTLSLNSIVQIIIFFQWAAVWFCNYVVHHKPVMKSFSSLLYSLVPYLPVYNAHPCIIRTLILSTSL